MDGDEIGAILQQPMKLVDGNVELAGLDHRLHFFEILGPVSHAARMHQHPAPAIGAATDAEPVGGRSRTATWFSLWQVGLTRSRQEFTTTIPEARNTVVVQRELP